MNVFFKRFGSGAAICALLAATNPARANFSISPSGSTTLLAVDASNQGTSLCAAASTECAAHVNINTAGAPIGISGTPWFVTGSGGTFPVTGTFWQSTQPVSIASLPALAAGSNAIGSITNTSFAATQSGTWNIGTVTTLPNITVGAALPAGSAVIGKVGIDQTTPGTTNLVAAGESGTWTVQPGNTANTTPWLATISQGGNSAPVKVASTVSSSDEALEVAVANATPIGQTTMSGSSPVVIASNQSTLPIAEQNGSAYPNKANFLSGANSSTGTSATTIISAPGSGKIYVTGVQCSRDDAGTTGIHVTLNDAATTVIVLPNNGGGGGNNLVLNTPLVVAATTALTFTSSASTSTVRCSAQGYNAT